MRRFTLLRWVAALTLMIAVAPRTAAAQESGSLSISGTFHMDYLQAPVGRDLAEVYTNGYAHGWTLTLHGVSYSHDYVYDEWKDSSRYGYWKEYATRVHATSFEFKFIGPDADVLNKVVSQQLVSGSLPGGAFVALRNVDYFNSTDFIDSGLWAVFDIGLQPVNPAAGVSFDVYAAEWDDQFLTDEKGYPLVQPQRLLTSSSEITDVRPGNDGWLSSYSDVVDIGSADPPLLPTPKVSIADGSVVEGDRGTTRLDLTVTLSSISTRPVTVSYATTNGTAIAKQDYTATSGTLIIPAGHTRGTISVSIKAERKAEPDETFTVRLTNAVGATINDGVATATILNDD